MRRRERMAAKRSSKTTYFVALNKLGSAELEDTRLDMFIDRGKPQEPTIRCDSIDQDGPLLRLAARTLEANNLTVDVHIPHHFVLYVVGGPGSSLRQILDRPLPDA